MEAKFLTSNWFEIWYILVYFAFIYLWWQSNISLFKKNIFNLMSFRFGECLSRISFLHFYTYFLYQPMLCYLMCMSIGSPGSNFTYIPLSIAPNPSQRRRYNITNNFLLGHHGCLFSGSITPTLETIGTNILMIWIILSVWLPFTYGLCLCEQTFKLAKANILKAWTDNTWMTLWIFITTSFALKICVNYYIILVWVEF